MTKTLLAVAAAAVVLLSGGIDSATSLAIARHENYELYALSFDYGQRHSVELEAARRVSAAVGVAEHRIAKLDQSLLAGSALTGGGMSVPKSRSEEQITTGIPITYVPARNTIFLAHALCLPS